MLNKNVDTTGYDLLFLTDNRKFAIFKLEYNLIFFPFKTQISSEQRYKTR